MAIAGKREAADRRLLRAAIRSWSDRELSTAADAYCRALRACAPERRKSYQARLRMIDHELVSRYGQLDGRQEITLPGRKALWRHEERELRRLLDGHSGTYRFSKAEYKDGKFRIDVQATLYLTGEELEEYQNGDIGIVITKTGKRASGEATEDFSADGNNPAGCSVIPSVGPQNGKTGDK